MVRCVTCGNNCCNSTYGPGPNGEDMGCPDCPGAYDHQAIYWANKTSIQFLGKKKEDEQSSQSGAL